jgi:hypothetical protein
MTCDSKINLFSINPWRSFTDEVPVAAAHKAHALIRQFISDYLLYFEKINIFFNIIAKKV